MKNVKRVLLVNRNTFLLLGPIQRATYCTIRNGFPKSEHQCCVPGPPSMFTSECHCTQLWVYKTHILRCLHPSEQQNPHWDNVEGREWTLFFLCFERIAFYHYHCFKKLKKHFWNGPCLKCKNILSHKEILILQKAQRDKALWLPWTVNFIGEKRSNTDFKICPKPLTLKLRKEKQ